MDGLPNRLRERRMYGPFYRKAIFSIFRILQANGCAQSFVENVHKGFMALALALSNGTPKTHLACYLGKKTQRPNSTL
jgi:hypothetical protein